MKHTVGIDLGTGTIKLACWDGTSIKKLVQEKTPENRSREDTPSHWEALGLIIKDILKTSGINARSAAIVAPDDKVIIRRFSMPLMTEEQLMYNLPFEFRDYITGNKSDFFYDYSVNAVQKNGEKDSDLLDITAVVAAKATISNYRRLCKAAGLQLETVIPSMCAYQNLIRSQASIEVKESAILDLGVKASRLTIFTGDVYETDRTAEIGMETLDQAISQELDLDVHSASFSKEQNFSSCLSLPCCERIYSAIANDVRKAVNFYGFNNQTSDLKDLYLCGGGSCIPQLVKVLEEELELNIHPISHLMNRNLSSDQDPELFAAAIGAAIQ